MPNVFEPEFDEEQKQEGFRSRRPPGGRGEGMHGVFFERDSVPFWEGEERPAKS